LAPVDVHDSVKTRLAGFDQRYTKGRREIVDVLSSAGRPLSVPEILATSGRGAQRGALPQSSAYRNLTVLLDVGIVHRLPSTDDHARYELAEDFAGHHHHLLCDTCGSVTDVSTSTRLERALDEAAHAAADENGFEVTRHRIDLLGRCAACR
jgi:Fur family ferric uptake transcriptional regulator